MTSKFVLNDFKNNSDRKYPKNEIFLIIVKIRIIEKFDYKYDILSLTNEKRKEKRF